MVQKKWKHVKNCQIVIKIAKKQTKKNQDCDLYPEIQKSSKNMYFMFECLKYAKSSLFISDYFIPKFPIVFEH